MKLLLLVLAAILLGIVGAAVALLTAAAATGSRALAAVVGALAVVLFTGGILWYGARGLYGGQRARVWLTGLVTGVTLLVVASMIILVVFAPAPSYIPLTATADTQFWDLPTGSRIAYTLTPARGEPRTTPVILIHGGPGAPEGGLELVMSTLAGAGFDVYYYHQAGAGLSERLEDVTEYTVARHVAVLEAIRAAIGAERMALVGESWGGTLIAHYLAAHPNRVAKSIVSSPGPIWAPAFAETDGLTASGRQDQRAAIEHFPRFMLAHVLLRTVGPQATHALFPDQTMDGVFQALVGRLDLGPGAL